MSKKAVSTGLGDAFPYFFCPHSALIGLGLIVRQLITTIVQRNQGFKIKLIYYYKTLIIEFGIKLSW